ncbi:permease [Salmonella enterica subsp. enterica]|uniref:Permease n=1 Tax=Salmonella enterica I TaxID=59201 RepID=A0A379WQ14_SALET|nr:permease [Salmonella enterica subsp. enterica]
MACCITHASGRLWFSDDCSCPLNVAENAGANVLWYWILSYYGPYWALPSALLSPSGLAVSIAFINSCSSLGGFLINKSLDSFLLIMVRQEYLL